MSGGSTVIGRARELGDVARGVDEVLAGSGRLFLLRGEPGIGKTRLADEIARVARGKGFLVAWGRCWEVGGAPALWPWVQVLRVLARDPALRDVTAAYEGTLARLLPDLRGAGAGDAGTGAAIADGPARFDLLDDLCALLRAAAERRPLLVVIDDLHAADGSSATLLRLLARDLRQTPVLVVATTRDREAHPSPSVAETIRAVAREGTAIDLARLAVDDVAAFLAARAGREIPRGLAARVHASTDGNPLFLDEVCRALEGRGDLDALPDELAVPPALRDAVRARLTAFDASARRVLDVAAVLGREFGVPLVASILGVAEDEVAPLVARAVDAGLVKERGLGQYEICHALFREASYADLPATRRSELHARAAEALERGGRAKGEVARHLLAALPSGSSERALACALEAAREAEGELAFEDAARILEGAVDRTEATVGEAGLCEALVALAEAHARAGNGDEARRSCDRVAAIARTRADPELLARAALALGAELMPGRHSPPLIAILEEARAALPVESSRLRALVLARLAAALQPARDPEVPIAMAREAVAMARGQGDAGTLQRVLHQAGSALVDFGDPTERRGWDTELLELSERAGDRGAVLRAHVRLFFAAVELGDVREADRQVEAHAEVAARLGASEHAWRTLMMRALRARQDGRFDDVATHRAQARRIAARSGIAEAASVEVFQDMGDALARWEDLPNLDALVRTLGSYPAAAAIEHILRAFFAGRRGEVARVRELFSGVPADSPALGSQSPAIRFLVEIAAWMDDTEMAGRMLAEFAPYAARFWSWGRILMIAEGPSSWLLGSLATTAGRHDEAERYFEDALARVTAAGMRPYEATVCLEYTRLLRARGPAAAGKLAEITRRGREIAESIGAPALAARFDGAADLAVRARVPPEAAPATTPIELTRDGESWSLRAGGRTFSMKDSRGMQLLAQLVANPSREFHVLTLLGAEGVDGGDAGEILDRKAEAAYRERAEDLREHVREAESFGDSARLGAARRELELLGEQLAAGVGLGGRSRRAGAAAERARINVQKRLREAIRRIGEQDRALGRQLDRAIRTGTFCAYDPA